MTYMITLDNESGLWAISLVERPAVEKDFLCLSESVKLQYADNSQHIITGVALLADTPIRQFSQERGEYSIVFTADVIKQIVERYSKEGLLNSVNLQHDSDRYVDGVVMVESYIKDSKRGINPVEFQDIPDGSWLVSFKVEDPLLWEEIVNTNHFNGFSIEGAFILKEKFSLEAAKEEDPIDNLINQIL